MQDALPVWYRGVFGLCKNTLDSNASLHVCARLAFFILQRDRERR